MNLAGKSNIKMMGGNNISVQDYAVSFMKRGGSTNIFVDPRLLSTFNAAALPINSFGQASPTGNKYLQGYAPLAVSLAGGTNLFLSGIPVGPQDRPHLVNLGEFYLNSKDDFIAGKGSPAYPGDTLPVNSFKALGANPDATARLMGGATACAIVGSLNKEYEMAMPNGYIQIVNGPSMNGPAGGLAATGQDIFSHALAGQGIDITADRAWFCRGSDGEVADVKNLDLSMNKLQDAVKSLNDLKDEQQEALKMLKGAKPGDTAVDQLNKLISDINEAISEISGLKLNGNLICRWSEVNNMPSQLARDTLWKFDIPDKAVSTKYIRHHLGPKIDVRPAAEDLRTIKFCTTDHCHWESDYGATPTQDPCLNMLDDFRIGYIEMGTTAGNFNSNGYTNLEQFKCDVMAARVMCRNCGTAKPSAQASGMKWFDHEKAYPAPKEPYNFGVVKTPLDYLKMIDEVKEANNCGETSTVATVLKRCQQIKPSLTKDDVIRALGSAPLAMNATLYLYVDSNSLVLTDKRPPGFVSAMVPDGKNSTTGVSKCGQPYDVIRKYVNTSTGVGNKSKADIPYQSDSDVGTDGGYPGWAFRESPKSTCTDVATWTPHSGYNNLLGVLDFSNQCEGGGGFCQPN